MWSAHLIVLKTLFKRVMQSIKYYLRYKMSFLTCCSAQSIIGFNSLSSIQDLHDCVNKLFLLPLKQQAIALSNMIWNYDMHTFFVHHLIWYIWYTCFVWYLIYITVFTYLKIYISMYYSYYLLLSVWTHPSIYIFQVFSLVSVAGSFGYVLLASWVGMSRLFLKVISLFFIYYS
jgi:hypothetical protein